MGVSCHRVSQAGMRVLREAKSGRMEELVSRPISSLTRLVGRGKRIKCVWVQGHCGVIGNEMADGAANDGRREEQRGVRCSWSSVKAKWRRLEKERVWSHERCRN